MTITTRKFGKQSEGIYLDGRHIGDISGNHIWLIDPVGAEYGTYKFATRDDAIAAVVSYATNGYWTKEI